MMAWVLIIAMMVPNVAFGADLGQSIMVGIKLPNGTTSAQPMEHVTLKVYSDNAGQVGTEIATYDLNTEGWQKELNNQSWTEEGTYWLVASASSVDYFLLDSDPVLLDLTDVTVPITKNVLLKSPVMTGTIYMPDGITPVPNGTAVGISAPNDGFVIDNGVYSCNVWYMGKVNPTTYYAQTTEVGLANSASVQLSQSDFTDGSIIRNFKLRDATQPFELITNQYSNFPMSWNEIPLNVEFRNHETTDENLFTFSLNSFDGSTYTKIKDLTVKSETTIDFRNTHDNVFQLSAQLDKTGVTFNDGQPIYVGITDPNISETIYVQMTPVSSTVLYRAERIGFVENTAQDATHDTYYHVLEVSSEQADNLPVIVKDSSGITVGTGMVKIASEQMGQYVMVTEVLKNSVPTTFEVTGMSPSNANANRFALNTQSDIFAWNISSDETNHYLAFYNDQIVLDTVTILEITSQSLGKVFDLTMTNKFTKNLVAATANHPAGIEFIIPIANIPSKNDYTIRVGTVNGSGSRGSYSLFDANTSMVEATVKDPSGTTALTEVFATLLPNKPYPPIDYSCENGVFKIHSAADGDYEFSFSSMAQDTYSASKPLYVSVAGGVVTAYSDPERTVVLSTPLSVNLQEGLYAGKAYLTDGITPANSLTINAMRLVSNNPSIALFKMAIKPDGSIYLPKVDDAYTISIETDTLQGAFVRQNHTISVSGLAIDPAIIKDMVLVKEQINGKLLKPDGSPVENFFFSLLVKNNQGETQPLIQEFTFDNINRSYRIGGLEAGDYTIEAKPEFSNTTLYSNSEPVAFTIDVNGESNLTTMDLTLKPFTEAPFTLEQNLLINFPTDWENINVDVELNGFGVTDASQFIVKLYNYDSVSQTYTATRELTLAPNTSIQFQQSYDQVYRFMAEYTKQVGDVTAGTKIYVGITDPVKSKTVYFDMMPVTVPVIWNANYLGFFENTAVGATHDTYYHKLGTTDSSNDYAPVVIKDSTGVVVGNGVVSHFDSRFGDSVMVSQVEKGKTPATYEIANTAFANSFAGDFRTEMQTHSFLIATHTDETNHYVTFYNEALTTTNITKMELISESKGLQLDLSQTTKYTKETITATEEMPAGVRYIIPIVKIASADDYNIFYITPQSEGGKGYYSLVDPNASILDVIAKDPTGTTQVTNVFADFDPNLQMGYARFEVVNGVFKLKEAQDGHYRFIFSSTGDDTYAASTPLSIWVADGVVYSDAEMTMEVSTLNVNLQEGTLAGYAYDHLGNPAVDSYIWVNRVEDDYSWSAMFAMGIKPNGKIFIPKVDGKYALSLEKGNLQGDFISDHQEVDVVNSSVVIPKDIKLVVEQARGLIFDPNGNSITNHEFFVRVFDATGNEMMDGFTLQHWYSEGKDMFVLGGLAAGEYALQAAPSGNNDVDYVSSDKVSFIIDAEGISNKPVMDLQFKVRVDLPLRIVHNDTLWTPTHASNLKVKLLLEGVDAMNANGVTAALYEGPEATGTKVADLTNANYQFLFKMNEYEHKFDAEYAIGEIAFDPAKSYFVKLSGFATGETVNVPIQFSDETLLEFTEYLGEAEGKVYHMLFIEGDGLDQYTATIFDANDQNVGTATIVQMSDNSREYLMTTTLTGVAPVRFEVVGMVPMFESSLVFAKNPQEWMQYWDVSSSATHHTIKLFNSNLTPEAIDWFLIYYQDEMMNEVIVFDSTENSNYTKTDLNEWVGGTQITVPVTAFEGNKWYSVRISGETFESGRGDFFFEDQSKNLLTFIVKDNAGNSVNWPRTSTLQPTFESVLDYFMANGKVFVTNATDGRYGITFDNEDVTQGMSTAYFFNISDGKAYTDADPINPITTPVSINFNEGLHVGFVKDENGVVLMDDDVYIAYEKETAEDTFNWMGTLNAKEDGSIVVPKVDGTYRLFLRSSRTDVVGEDLEITILNGVITGGQDMNFSKVQVFGEVFMNTTTPVTEPHFSIALLDESGALIKEIDKEWLPNDAQGFKLAGLAPGNYQLVAKPYFEFRELGYIDSLPVAFTIKPDGTTTSSSIKLTFVFSPRDSAALEAYIQKVKFIKLAGMTTTSAEAFIEALDHAMSFDMMNTQAEFDAAYVGLETAYNALEVKTPILTASITTPTNSDVIVTTDFGFAIPDSDYQGYFKIGETGTWAPFAGIVVMTNDNTLYVKTSYTHEGKVFEKESSYVVSNIDKLKPVISLAGDRTMTLEYGATFTDPGYLVYDNKTASGAIVKSVTGTVNTSLIGTYTLTYTATDAAGNTASTVRTVNVVDKTQPTVKIVRTGTTTEFPAELKVVGSDLLFEVVAADAIDGSNVIVAVTMNGTALTPSTGVYTAPMNVGVNYLRVTVKDQSGNTIQKTVVVSNEPITLTADKTAATNQDVVITATTPGITLETVNFVHDSTPGNTQTVSVNDTIVSFTANIAGLTTASKAYTYKVTNIDKLAPAAPVLAAPSMTPSKTVTYLTMTGDETLMYSLNGGTTWIAYAGAIEVSANGAVASKAVDAAGNETLGNSISVTWIDKTAPTMTQPVKLFINGVEATAGQTVKAGDVMSVKFIATDNNPNVKGFVRLNTLEVHTEALTSGTEFNYTIPALTVSSETNIIRVWVEDEAGNKTAEFEVAKDFSIDVKAPTMTLNGGDMQVPVNGVFADPGVNLFDDLDGSSLTPVITGSVDVSTVGTYTLTYDAVDTAGNAATTLTRVVTVVDQVAPFIETSLIDQTVNKASFTFTAEALDNVAVASFTVKHNGVTITPTSGTSYTVTLAEGANTFVLDAADNSGNSENTAHKTFTVNYVMLPSGTPIISASTLSPTNQNITVSIEYPVGAAVTEFAVDTQDNWAAYTGSITVNASPTTIYARTKETADSEFSEVASLTLTNFDNTAPSTPTTTASMTAPTNQNVLVTLAGEAGSTIYYSIGQEVTGATDLKSLKVYTAPILLSQNATVYAIAVDAAKNKSNVSSIIINNIDKTAPIATVLYSQTMPTRSSVFATLSVSEPYEMASGEVRYHEFTANGTHTFTLSDLAGNMTTVVATVNNIDKTAPAISVASAKLNGSVVTAVKGGVLLDITAAVNDTSTVSATVSLGTQMVDLPLLVAKTATPGLYQLTGKIQMPTDFDGQANLIITVQDAAGNRTTQTLINNLVIDNTKPAFNVSITNVPVNGFIVDATMGFNVVKGNSTLEFGFTETLINQSIETLSTVINASTLNDGLEHTLYFKATDAVGNVSDIQTLTFKWDNTKPVTPSILIDAPDQTNQLVVTMAGVVENGEVTVRRTTQTGSELIFQGAANNFMQGIEVTLRAGVNNFTIVNKDLAGNASDVGTYAITYDGIAPVIDMMMAANGDITATTNETLTDVKYWIDGESQVVPVFTNGIASLPEIAEGGEHFLILTGKDAAGNEGTGRLSIIIVSETGNARELSEGLNMAEGSFTAASELTLRTFEVSAGTDNSFIGEPLDFHLSGDASVDPENGVVVLLNIGLGFPVNTKLNFYNETTSQWQALDASIEHGDSFYNNTNEIVKVSIDGTKANGDYVVVDAVNGDIEVAPGQLVGFMRHFSGYAAIQDVTPPTVQITTSAPATPVQAASMEISYSVSETSTIMINGVSQGSKAAGTYTYTMNLVEGVNQFSVQATDLANLVSTTEVLTVVRDSSFESLTASMVGVANASTTRNGSVVVTANATDINFKQMTIDGVVYTNTAVNATVALDEGVNTIQIVALDTAGNQKTIDLTVTKDTQAPEIQITGISDGDIISGNVSANVTGDYASVSWRITSTGVNQTGNTGNISYAASAGTKDLFTLVVDALDAVGNLTRETLSFQVDTGAPVITESAYDALSKNNQNISIGVNPVNADVQINIYKNAVRDTSVTVTESPDGTYNFSVSAEGTYEVVVEAINASSVSTKTLNFVIDKTAPVITVTGVTNGQTVTAKPTIVFSSTSAVTATLTKSGSAPQAIGSGYQVQENGTYTLVVTSTDAANNTATSTISFTVNVASGGSTGGGVITPPVGPPVGPPVTPPVVPPTTGGSSVIEETFTAKEMATKSTLAIDGEIDMFFDAAAVKKLATGGEVVITAVELDAATLPALAQKIVGNRPVYDFNVTVGGKAVTSFGSGNVTIRIPYTLGANEDPSSIVVYYIDGNGKLKTMLSKYENGAVSFITNHFSIYAVGYNKISFIDVPKTEWYASAVSFLASKNIITGKGEGQFSPKANITRAEIVAILANMAGADLSKYKSASFNDVKSTDWFMPAVEWANAIGLVSGTGDKTFSPNAPISRQDLAVMLTAYARIVANFKLPVENALNVFSDQSTIASYANASIDAMQRAGFISGKPGNQFDPRGKATRAEVAKILELMVKSMVE